MSPLPKVVRLDTHGSGEATPGLVQSASGGPPSLEIATVWSTPSEGSSVNTSVMGLLAVATSAGEIVMFTCWPTKLNPDGGGSVTPASLMVTVSFVPPVGRVTELSTGSVA